MQPVLLDTFYRNGTVTCKGLTDRIKTYQLVYGFRYRQVPYMSCDTEILQIIIDKIDGIPPAHPVQQAQGLRHRHVPEIISDALGPD
jgi:hypothetical protein